MSALPVAEQPATDRVAASIEHLVRTYGPVRAVDDVTFSVNAGEIFGLLGPNGAGKTTTLKVLTTLARPDSGRVSVFGRDATRQTLAVRRLIGYLPQQLSVDAGLSGYENVWLFARLFDVPRAQRNHRIAESLTLMGLDGADHRLVSTYSGGMVRRLELAQALVSSPQMLILDEPSLGLDPVARGDLWQRITRLRQERGLTVLLTTHYMEEADSLCDRVALMHRGRIQALDAPAALKARLSANATLEDVFRHFTGDHLDEQGGFGDVRRTRRTASRLG
jgi:ABC-2 type transport system ATP-binding protein